MEELLPLLHPGSVYSLESALAPFRGTFDHTLDAKNRLTVPARYRATLADGVVLAMPLNQKPCVLLWRPQEYEDYTRRMTAELPPLSGRLAEVERFFYGNSHDTELDAAGRVMIPAFLVEHASLDKEVLVIGAGNRMELWDKQGWSEHEPEMLINVADLTASVDAAA